ncbi:MAG: S-layer homology domain-containing protein [Oscillospiraceae bacterium]|nr:S-layer homology domain-containing protein [Oscillospiraceae bacterium]
MRGNRMATWPRDVWGSFTAFSGQPYRITICGQRSFPPGMEQELPPLERVPAQYQHIYDLLQNNDFARLFPGYNAFTTVYIDAVPLTDVFLLGLRSNIRALLIEGILGGAGIDGIADAIMNDPARVNQIVRDLVNEVIGTTVYSADKETGELLTFFADTLTALNSDAGHFFTVLKGFDGSLEEVSRSLQVYYHNIRMLDSISRASRSLQFTQTINNVIAAYQRDLADAFAVFGRELVEGKLIDLVVGAVAGKPTVAITSALNWATSQVRSVGGLETIIVSDNLNVQVMNTFRDAAERITLGYFTSQDVETYRNAFYLARGLQVMRYEAMRTRFGSGTAERSYIDRQLANLRRMTHASFIFSVPFGQLYQPSPITEFADVGLHWGAHAIQFVNDQGLMRGTGPATFEPDTDFSRAMAVATLYRMAHSDPATAPALVPAQNRQVFDDVDANTWYSSYVAWAYENNIVTGVGGNLFAPGRSVTRQEFAVMMHRFAGVMGYDTALSPGFTLTFPDTDLISDWAEVGKRWANYNGLIMGTGLGTLNPTGTATRAECATVLMRFIMDVAAVAE